MLLAACYHRAWILKPDENNPGIHFEINGGLSLSPYWYEKRRGLLAPILRWQAAAEG
jgi:lipopolysaccharide transport system ATP-binding protein